MVRGWFHICVDPRTMIDLTDRRRSVSSSVYFELTSILSETRCRRRDSFVRKEKEELLLLPVLLSYILYIPYAYIKFYKSSTFFGFD